MGKKFVSYTNGVVNKRFKVGEPIPEGFYIGVTISEDRKKEIAEKRKKTMLERYGVENPMYSKELKDKLAKNNLEKYGNVCSLHGKEVEEKTRQTNLERYGTECPFQAESVKEKIKQTSLERYGVDNPSKSPEIIERIKKSNQERLGVDFPMQSEKVLEKTRETSLQKYGTLYPNQSDVVKEKIVKTNIERYGASRPAKSEEVKKKAEETNLRRYGHKASTQNRDILEKSRKTNREKYGVDWTCQRPEARAYSNDSVPNKRFASLLDANGIQYEREFHIKSYSYDFKIGKVLIEINPSYTHNVLVNPFGRDGLDKDYHYNKSHTAEENGCQCIHVFDWDDVDKVIEILKPKTKIYARKCEIREVSIDDTGEFINKYHLQGMCRGQDIRVGLYYRGELVSIMTFGKPRYNKNYEYELLRYCSSHNVVGGAEKLFKYFIKTYNPRSVISYCDRSKFVGRVYEKLGFTLKTKGKPSKHWYSLKEKNHITDNLLRQRGYDQLFNENYGKGTSNEELILDRGYLPIYDCGQDVWVYEGGP